MAKIRRLLIAMALALGATLFVAPASPANALPVSHRLCFTLPGATSPILDRTICIDVPVLVEVEFPIPPGCKCDVAIRFRYEDVINEQIEEHIIYAGNGLQNLGRAATNPEKEKEFREQAIKSFQASAELLGKNEIALDRVGYFDLEKGEFLDIEAPKSLAITAEHLVAGLSILQGDRSNVEKAMAEFDAAYEAYSMGG